MASARTDVYVGPAGWSYEDWKGPVYPDRTPSKFDALKFMARYFDLVEINSTFYRPPARRTVESWARRVRDRERFRFTVKVWKEFTHGDAGEREAAEFASALQPLTGEGRLGALLLQFPFWFKNENKSRRRLADLARWFSRVAPLNVEVRHTSWLNREPMTWLHNHGLGFVNIDLPQGRSSPPPTSFATSDVGYVRLHGRNADAWFSKGAGRDQKYDYHYDGGEIDEWVRRVKEIGGKTQVTYVVANNHFRGQAPANALQIMARIAGRRVPMPRRLAEKFPALLGEGEVVDDDDGDLF